MQTPLPFLRSEIRRVNRNLLVVNAGLTLGSLLLGYANAWYLSAGFAIPLPPGGYLTLLLYLPVFLLGCWNLGKWWRRTQYPYLHPIVSMVRQYGPEFEVAWEIDHELAATPTPAGAKRRTASWLLQSTLFSFTCTRLPEAVLQPAKPASTHRTYQRAA